MKKVALVTGANRGIGQEVARQLSEKGLQVWLGCRDPKKIEGTLQDWRAKGLDVNSLELDVSDEKSIGRAFATLSEKAGRLDVLVNNAGIFPEKNSESGLESGLTLIRAALETNTFGPLLASQHAAKLMKKNKYGRIVNVSSGMGQLSDMNGGHPAYRISKTALNAVTRILADELSGTGILVNSACPGWVKTDMGGPGAERSIPEGADTLVWLATLPEGGPTGGFFRDREPIDW